MANQWLRLWHDMPTDPKWRTISRASGQRIGDVIAVFVHVLVDASNATERGRTQSFAFEDVASALDLEPAQVEAIWTAMQSRVMDGNRVLGWEKRQPVREDGAAGRAKAWRERNRTQTNATERMPNAEERSDTDTDTDTDTEKEQKKEPLSPLAPTKRAYALPSDWKPTDEMIAKAKADRPDIDVSVEADKFRDYWTAKGGKEGRKLDWDATWRNWVRNARPSARGAVANNDWRAVAV